MTGRDTQRSSYNNRWCCNRERKGRGACQRELMCELFQECRRGNILIGTLRLDKDVRFKRSKAIIKYTTGHCCSKNIFCASPPNPLSLFLFSTLFSSFLPEVKRKSHLHQAKLWWAALSVQKTWGFDSSHSMVINYFSTVVGPPLPSLSLPAAVVVVVVVVVAGGNT